MWGKKKKRFHLAGQKDPSVKLIHISQPNYIRLLIYDRKKYDSMHVGVSVREKVLKNRIRKKQRALSEHTHTQNVWFIKMIVNIGNHCFPYIQ